MSGPIPRRFSRWQLASHALTLVGAVFAVQVWSYLTFGPSNGWDASIYYRANLDNLYGGWVVGGADSFQYAPVFAQLIAPLHVLPFDVFLAIWRAAALAIVVVLAGPLTVPVLLWSPVASEVNAGNVNIFLAGAIALGFRVPGSWAVVLLTKITPGVGLLWFAVRREGRALAAVAAVTGVVSALSFALSPGQWIAWITLIVGNSGSGVVTYPFWIPLAVRLPVAAIAIVVAARFGWRWVVPVAATLAAPVLYFPTQSIAIGALPFARQAIGRWRDRALARRSAGRAAPPLQPANPGPEGDRVPAQVLR